MVLPVVAWIIIGAITAGAAVGVAVAVARITYSLITEFFQKFRHRVRENPNLIPFSALDALKSGNVKRMHVGLFNPLTEAVVEAAAYESSQVDAQVAEAHRDSTVVVWN